MTGHSFTDRTGALLDSAERLCVARGSRLTELRRLVLGLVLDAGRPVGAYDLLDGLRADKKGAAPPTVYRALDFLLEQGLIHKIQRLSAFVGCTHVLDASHAHAGGCHPHAAQFLICTGCGQVTELDDRNIVHALVDATRDIGFMVRQSTVEAEGLCGACRTGSPVPARADGAP
ncbi:transcriptional repressor [Gluconacetobacter azotocaptans]|uniref:Transcriptional repressor n=1 Tax=Gluconacetobacter azotocaptans TaxID=142834 RepID=A0A7W4JR34_9PROT|nr:transcriptional repressor [Gluconacetobacter azotocaptans]MBB2189318.1 transcriptional repressor [Gluconacetobacter azotocaptans]MBM9401287.1 transcriptional repressor [Gluconacetobacter azotocaptans]